MAPSATETGNTVADLRRRFDNFKPQRPIPTFTEN